MQGSVPLNPGTAPTVHVVLRTKMRFPEFCSFVPSIFYSSQYKGQGGATTALQNLYHSAHTVLNTDKHQF